MAVINQLYELQEIDNEIEFEERSLSQKLSQVGARQALDYTQARLSSEQQRLDELKHQQHSAEWEIDDMASKIAAAEQQLYGGKITNPKELANLQHEISIMKTRSDQTETKALQIIDQVEAAERSVAAATDNFKRMEDDWRWEQQKLSDEIEKLKSSLEGIRQKRQQLVEEIEAEAVRLYEKIRKQKKQPVARVEQGICRSCRISLSAAELQRARSGNLIQCGSCGRILFLP